SVIEFPGALQAANAKELADKAATRAALAQERLAYRIADIDERIRPGATVSVPGRAGTWRVEAWEWRESGVELELLHLPQRLVPAMPAEAGRALPQDDDVATGTRIEAFELPWLGTGSGEMRQAWLAATSESAGWRGAALYAETGAGLEPVGSTGTRRSVVGTTLGILPARATPLLDRHSQVNVQLASVDFVLENRSLKDLAQGANRALIGEEIVQFAVAEPLGDARWRLSGLLRGRGGTEHLAQAERGAGARFVLLDESLVALDMAAIGRSDTLAAIGLADEDPAFATIAGPGFSLRPLTPVHPRVRKLADGGLDLGWTRRARGAWTWDSTVEVPLAEQSESYEVGIGDPDAPLASYTTSEPSLSVASAALAGRAGEPLWVRQIGTHARSLPLLLTTLS
ncbi:MAG: phage tail protein, partial [Alteraurantiacibacter sp.]